MAMPAVAVLQLFLLWRWLGRCGLRIFFRVGYLGFLELTGFVGWWVGVGELWI